MFIYRLYLYTQTRRARRGQCLAKVRDILPPILPLSKQSLSKQCTEGVARVRSVTSVFQTSIPGAPARA